MTTILGARPGAAPTETMRQHGQTSPWWKGATIYHIYPRSFKDTNGDGIGDLPGVIEGLDHIASLGVDAIWISPFFTSPMRDFGYDVADYCDVDPSFGTLSDFDRLLEKAHALGLKVIIDQVYSHTSDDHAWFAESRSSRTNLKADWYVWADAKPEGSPPTNWQSVFGGPAWTWDARRKQYYMHNFLSSQPQLNVRNPEVQDALLSVAKFWMDRGVDGFRLDAINFAMHDPRMLDNPTANTPPELITRPFDMQHHTYNQSSPEIVGFIERVGAVLDQYDDRFTVAEVGGPDPIAEMRAFTQGEGRLNSAYNFDFLYAPDLSVERIKASIDQWSGAEDEGWPSWAFSNHDAPRALTRWSNGQNDLASAKLYMLLLCTLRGNPFIYQGEELALPQGEVAFEHLQDNEAIENWPHTLGRDGARTPMPWIDQSENAGFSSGSPWLPVDPKQAERSANRQQGDRDSMLAFCRELISFRSQSETLRLGSFRYIDAPDGVLAFVREHDGDAYICLFNLGTADAQLAADVTGHSQIMFSNTGDLARGADVPVTLPAQTALIAKRV